MQERTDAMNHIFLICQLQESDKTSIFQDCSLEPAKGVPPGASLIGDKADSDLVGKTLHLCLYLLAALGRAFALLSFM